jgi:hypothetical protein
MIEASFEVSMNDRGNSYSPQSLPLSFILTSNLATFIHTHLKACHFHSYSPQSLLLSLMLNSKLATIIDAQLKACHFHSHWPFLKVDGINGQNSERD